MRNCGNMSANFKSVIRAQTLSQKKDISWSELFSDGNFMDVTGAAVKFICYIDDVRYIVCTFVYYLIDLVGGARPLEGDGLTLVQTS